MNEQKDHDGSSLIETYPVEDKYVDGLGVVEVTGPNVRLIFYSGRSKRGAYDREVAERLVMPMEQIMPLLKAIITTSPIFRTLDTNQLCQAITSSASGVMN